MAINNIYLVPASSHVESIGVRYSLLEQIRHSKEVLGRTPHLFSSKPWNSVEMNKVVFGIVENELGKLGREMVVTVGRSILLEASAHRLDPLFLLAMIKTESRFNIKARGIHGEIGLLQLLPKTAKWIAARNGIRWTGSEALENPAYNIKLGAAYLSSLRKRFSADSRLYISAYNMGPKNVFRLKAKDITPNIYAAKVVGNYVKIYDALLLSATSPRTGLKVSLAD